MSPQHLLLLANFSLSRQPTSKFNRLCMAVEMHSFQTPSWEDQARLLMKFACNIPNMLRYGQHQLRPVDCCTACSKKWPITAVMAGTEKLSSRVWLIGRDSTAHAIKEVLSTVGSKVCTPYGKYPRALNNAMNARDITAPPAAIVRWSWSQLFSMCIQQASQAPSAARLATPDIP